MVAFHLDKAIEQGFFTQTIQHQQRLDGRVAHQLYYERALLLSSSVNPSDSLSSLNAAPGRLLVRIAMIWTCRQNKKVITHEYDHRSCAYDVQTLLTDFTHYQDIDATVVSEAFKGDGPVSWRYITIDDYDSKPKNLQQL